MLTRLVIRNFKTFEEVEIELGSPVVFIGPNNSGKTSAMQALALWDTGIKRWHEKRAGKNVPEKRAGVTINRKDLLAIPVPKAALLWRLLHTRDVQRVDGRTKTNNVRIDLIVDGISNGESWTSGLEFDYANEESFYCRPLRRSNDRAPERMQIPEAAAKVSIAFLPPMSGLVATETRLDPGAVNVRVGEGRTAEVLRNLCFHVMETFPQKWQLLVGRIQSLFGAELGKPSYVVERGEVTMGYREHDTFFDLSSSGRGLQQTLLILAYMYANPGAVILLDEPDAHLEILRQREIYKLVTDVATENGNQVIAASHSEVLLNEAAGRDMVIAFVGKPHRIGDQKSQVRKALAEIGFDQYYQAEQAGWVLYLEGSTDLSILQAFARRLGHDKATQALERPFVRYVGNQPEAAERHYYGIREALPELAGVAVFDRLERDLPKQGSLRCLTWKRREIENYLCTRRTLEEYARKAGTDDKSTDDSPQVSISFGSARATVNERVEKMRAAIDEVSEAMKTLGKGSPWDVDVKSSDDFLAPVFAAYFRNCGLPNLMEKKRFYELAEYIPSDEIDAEIREKLAMIAKVAESRQRR